MSNSVPGHRRYEILLPKRFNDGTLVPDDLIAMTTLELREQFGAVSSETQTIQGIWIHQGQMFRDELMRIYVEVPDTDEAHDFIIQLKQRLKERFEQLEVWVVSFPVRVE